MCVCVHVSVFCGIKKKSNYVRVAEDRLLVWVKGDTAVRLIKFCDNFSKLELKINIYLCPSSGQ